MASLRALIAAARRWCPPGLLLHFSHEPELLHTGGAIRRVHRSFHCHSGVRPGRSCFLHQRLGLIGLFLLSVLAVAAYFVRQPRTVTDFTVGGRSLMGVVAGFSVAVTLLAAQTDFTEAGELMLFVNEEQVNFLESMMWDRGVLDAEKMSGAFQLLRSSDLIWSRMVREYLLGERRPPNDLMAWNADQTRMPYRMHSEYLRKLFLNNDLATGRYEVDGRPIAISDIRTPIFAIATVKDHVAPWQSVFKINLLANSQDVTFVLTSGGHNAGIVSEPGHPGRSYQIASRQGGAAYVDAETWECNTPHQDGSWWPAWEAWLSRYSSELCEPPGMGAPAAGCQASDDAPGAYVFQA